MKIIDLFRKQRYEIFTTFQSGVGIAELVGEVECNPLEMRLKILKYNAIDEILKSKTSGTYRYEIPLAPATHPKKAHLDGYHQKYTFQKSRWVDDEDYSKWNGRQKSRDAFIVNF